MQRTIKIKLSRNEVLISTMKTFSDIVRIVNDIAIKHKTRNKTKLHFICYKSIRKQFPNFPTGLIQTARDIVCEQLKREKQFRKFNFKELTSIRYDKRNLRVNTEHNIISISSINGRLKLNYKDNMQSMKYKQWKVKAGTLKCFNGDL
jgi:predicted transposase